MSSFSPFVPLLVVLSSSFLALRARALDGTLMSFQSGPRLEGSVFLSRVLADPNDGNIVHLLGNNERTDGTTECTYMTLNLETFETSDRFEFGTGKEVCHHLALDDNSDDDDNDSAPHIYMVGHSEPKSMIDEIEMMQGLFGIGKTEYFGMLLDVTSSTTTMYENETLQIKGAGIMHDSIFNYPLAAASHNETLYVVSLQTNVEKAEPSVEAEPLSNNSATETDSSNNSTEVNGTQEEPIFLENPSQVLDKGDLFDMVVEAYTSSGYPDDNSTEIVEVFRRSIWQHTIETERDDTSILDVAGILLLDEFLIVGGSTDGIGMGLGVANSVNHGVDGFVTKLVRSTGEMYSDTENTAGSTGSLRIQSNEGQDDYIKGMCRGHSKNHFFVTGSTTGRFKEGHQPDGETRAFLTKIHTQDLTVAWTVELSASPPENVSSSPVEGLACAQDHNNTFVYFAGNVYNGGTLRSSTTGLSLGGSDVFFAKVDLHTGDVEYVRQIGSAGDEMLAPLGGLVVTSDGAPVLFGQTTGDLYRIRNMTVESDLIADYFITMGSPDGTLPEQITSMIELTEPPTISPTLSPTTVAPTPTPEIDDDSNHTEYTFYFSSIKLTLQGITSYIEPDAGDAFENATMAWYHSIYADQVRRRLEESNVTSISDFETNVTYWGGSVQGNKNVITYNQEIKFKSDSEDVDYEYAESMIVEPFLDEDFKQEYVKQLSQSHETFEPLTNVTDPKVPDRNRPKNAAGNMDYKIFLYVGLALMIACCFYGIFTMKNMDNQQDDGFNPKDDADRPEQPLEVKID